jgi:hypothetical protein
MLQQIKIEKHAMFALPQLPSDTLQPIKQTNQPPCYKNNAASILLDLGHLIACGASPIAHEASRGL